jgi:hypothetical protein
MRGWGFGNEVQEEDREGNCKHVLEEKGESTHRSVSMTTKQASQNNGNPQDQSGSIDTKYCKGPPLSPI